MTTTEAYKINLAMWEIYRTATSDEVFDLHLERAYQARFKLDTFTSIDRAAAIDWASRYPDIALQGTFLSVCVQQGNP